MERLHWSSSGAGLVYIMMIQIIAMTEVFQVVGKYEALSPGIFGERSPMA